MATVCIGSKRERAPSQRWRLFADAGISVPTSARTLGQRLFLRTSLPRAWSPLRARPPQTQPDPFVALFGKAVSIEGATLSSAHGRFAPASAQKSAYGQISPPLIRRGL